MVPAGRLVSHPAVRVVLRPVAPTSEWSSLYRETDIGIATVVVFSSRDLAALRRTLHSVWDDAHERHRVVVLASRLDDDTASYLMRQYQRGGISSFGFDSLGRGGSHCDLDRTFHLATGQYIARVSDDIEVQTGWLDTALDVMEAFRPSAVSG